MGLFNKKTLGRAVTAQAFKPTSKQMDAAAAWAVGLRSGSIQKQKETSLHGSFREEIVQKVLGYTSFAGGDNWTVDAETTVGPGQVDLALGAFSDDEQQIIAPFELKDGGTDLDAIMSGRHKSPVQQAWEYAMDAPGSKWVLLSNYVELRLYAVGHGRDRHESWRLERLSETEELARFHVLLCAGNLLGGRTAALLEESAREDRDITDRLYRDYKDIRDRLIQTIDDQNRNITRENAIRHAQKLLDRVLFVAFAEDTGLLPQKTLERVFETTNPYNPQPVWDNFKGLFAHIDKGHRIENQPEFTIPAYNGGLFAADAALDTLAVPDTICESFKRLGEYDFQSEVSVWILGHIFEQSISDIEAMQAEARGEEAPAVGKKKREGVIYTPDFVTRFIVEQTLGRYLQERFLALLRKYSEDRDFPTSDKEIRWKTTKKDTTGKVSERKFWLAYQAELLQIKVLDPACGSGAFLIAAFDYLDDEYQRVNEHLGRIGGKEAKIGTLFDPHRMILTSNLYGVDVNTESVEITKLSLWLRTAKRGEALASLRANIRIGNSLIGDSDYHQRAFTWREAFPEIFEQGGFHIVIGNPPYVRMELLKPFKPYLEKRYEVVSDRADLYCYFYELGFRLLRPGGKLGFISSSTFFRTGSGSPLRTYLSRQAEIEAVIDFGDIQIFGGVTAYPAIVTMAKPKAEPDTSGSLRFLKLTDTVPEDLTIHFSRVAQKMARWRLTDASWQFESDALAALREKIRAGGKTLGEVYGAPLYGIKTGLNDAFIVDRETRDRLIADDPQSAELLRPFLKGEDLKKWRVEPRDLWLINIPKGKIPIDDYPAIRNHLLPFRGRLEKRATKQQWFELQQAQLAYQPKFEQPKIMFGHFASERIYSFDSNNYLSNDKSYIIPGDDHFLLAILNSSVGWFFIKGVSPAVRGGYHEMRVQYIETTPIPAATDAERAALATLAEHCQAKAGARYGIGQAVRRRIPDLCPDGVEPKLSKKLKQWWTLDFRAFLQEIKRLFKTDIPVAERGQWEDFLKSEGEKVTRLTVDITALEREIDALVYKLFDLTGDEIALLEASLEGQT